MLHEVISRKAKAWLAQDDCPHKELFAHIIRQGGLRDAQIEALEVYLFLKIKGENKPLWRLFSEGFFAAEEDLDRLNINQEARQLFRTDAAAHALFQFSRYNPNGNGKAQLPELEKYILERSSAIDYTRIIREIFYNVSYTDYLLSLPMGAGKTYLMAGIIYLDLYFARLKPDNKLFAHNFIILAPSGLKSSIIPSLKTIQQFNPLWVLPEPAASDVRRAIRFEVLDQAKTAKRSNKTQNPNAQKINQHQPFEDLMGLVVMTNAEKVILDRLALDDQGNLFEKTEDEKDKDANELRNIIGKLPNLQIHIDEVHHAATDDIKLRQVVNGWNAGGTVNSVVGFSGTPYLATPEKIEVAVGVNLKFSNITNTVFYYPLTQAIERFLKKPQVEETRNLDSLQIIRKGVEDFKAKYWDKVYDNGTNAKLAIYCSSIERLEEQIAPFLVAELGIDEADVLKFHKGNKVYTLPKENELEFALLDTPYSRKKIVLLVQIGKEGWDCKSLTGVILSQKGDSPTNMVLQTACRCLRQVDKDKVETAIIWLNEDNAKSLDKQLKEEQQTSIAELNSLHKSNGTEAVKRFARLDYLKLPPLDFYQLKVTYQTLLTGEEIAPAEHISKIEADDFYQQASVTSRDLNLETVRARKFVGEETGARTNFNRWLQEIYKESFGTLAPESLFPFGDALRRLFQRVTLADETGARYFNERFNQRQIRAQVRLAFHQRRTLQSHDEIISDAARMLIVEKLNDLPAIKTHYPSAEETKQILDLDMKGGDAAKMQSDIEEAQQQIREMLEKQGKADLLDMMLMPQTKELSLAVRNKDRAFHFLPYNFSQSKFELEFLREALTVDALCGKRLEIYFNGEKDITDFRIECYTRKSSGGAWWRLGKYTPDFLVIERRDAKIYRALIIETKGSGFSEQTAFLQRRAFVENEFVPFNNKRFGYNRFDYLYLVDSDDMHANLAKLNRKVCEFFND